jgi:crotonobetainyl-CoA:carnitine CoA-transferase CaiB-like acyl-CoA transferase
LLSAAGVPVAPVLRDEEAHRDPFLAENGYYQRHTDPRVGELTASRGFAEFVGSDVGFHRLHPDLGGDGREVLAEYGIAAERIAALAKDGVIFPPPADA